MAFKNNTMKKLIRLIIIGIFSNFLASDYLFAQGGNLQFNQVININPGENYTVPQNKVFKIESISTGTGSGTITTTFSTTTPIIGSVGCVNCFFSTLSFLTIDNVQLTCGVAGYQSCSGCAATNTGPLTLQNIALPIWLKSGKAISISNIVSGILVTGIEFNITN
jgi:hypothetical protein